MYVALASEIMQALRVIVAQPMQKILCITDGVECHAGEMQELIRDTPFKYLGAGHFSAAFKHAAYPDYCFKIGFRAEDSGAMYAAWCRDNKLPNTPEIIHMDRWPEAYMVCMPCYLSAHKPPPCVVRWDIYNITRVLGDYLHGDFCCSSTDGATYKALETESVYSTCKAIQTFFKGVAQIDMHGGNWMWDKDGNIIITDPVSFTIKKTERAPMHKPVKLRPKFNWFMTEPIRSYRSSMLDLVFAENRSNKFFKQPERIMCDRVRFRTNANKGFIKSGGVTHLQHIAQGKNKNVPGLWLKLLNRI